jgi:2'-5' RNA ligase
VANESAIIMPIAEVEPIISPLRLQYDRSAALGVPAHITLLFPFYPPQKAEEQLENLAELFKSVPGFEFSLSEVRRFPQAVYLHPDQTNRFIGIINKLLQKWPDCKPYGGAFSDIVPHLTVADQVNVDVLDTVQASLRDRLPIPCFAAAAWLLFSDDQGFWSRRERFPLGAPDIERRRIYS